MSNLPETPAFLDAWNPVFPNPEKALKDPDGLLAIGGNLQPETLANAYRQGIFPWYEQGQPILWWSPSTRAVLTPGHAYISKSMRKLFRRQAFHFTTDQAFDRVIEACAAPRSNADGTWITPAMVQAYKTMHRAGLAHSIECWQQNELVGGLYGLHFGKVFCGESMFSHTTNASKAAFIMLSHSLALKGFAIIDCQLPNPHLKSLGVQPLKRDDFLINLKKWIEEQANWPNGDALEEVFGMLSLRQQGEL